jgi:hypothetical protein
MKQTKAGEDLGSLKTTPVCQDTVVLHAGEHFFWVNSGNSACTLTNCVPLQSSTYVVLPHGSTPATVKSSALPGDYPYQCKYDTIEFVPQPVIIIR